MSSDAGFYTGSLTPGPGFKVHHHCLLLRVNRSMEQRMVLKFDFTGDLYKGP